ncbi:MAG TPA: DUF2784 family protein [Candidatus Paceibacterota bacterium]|nr:DUF2784 family protein [Candidatus Paceibacterota bacterium]
MLKKFLTILLVAALSIVHGIIVLGGTISLPMVLIYPNTMVFYFAGIAVLLVTWALFSDCPLTVAEQKLRRRIHWPNMNGDFTQHYLGALTGIRLPEKVHAIVERVYLVAVLIIILLRWRLA